MRFLKRHTISIWPRIKTRILVSMTLTFFILLWPYFLMFRELKILIFKSWYTTIEILLFYNFANLFCVRFRWVEFGNWLSVCVSVKKIIKKSVSILYVRPHLISDTLNMFVQNDAGKQKIVDVFFLIRCLWKNILEIDNVSFLNLTNSIIVNYIVFPFIRFISISKNIAKKKS